MLSTVAIACQKEVTTQIIAQKADDVITFYVYRLRKENIEPTLALIKELFDLTGDKKLPYKGLDKVSFFDTLTIFVESSPR